MSLAVVGADFPNKRGPGRRFEISMCLPGEPVELRPEPGNRFDERAVAVYSARGIQIGYLSAERCGLIGARIAAGIPVAVRFQTKTRFGAVIRASFDGSEPVLPEPDREAETKRDGDDFYRGEHLDEE